MDESTQDNARLQQEIQIFHLGLMGGIGGLSLGRTLLSVFLVYNLEKKECL